MNEIEVLNEREHVLKRSQMYLGSLAETDFQDYFLDDDKISLKTVRYVPALIKIINEIIDNVFDIAIKTDFKCNKLDVIIEDDHVIISDNGTGIPVKKIINKNTNKEEWMPYTAWGHANAGSNFGDDNKGIGTNGVGSFCTNVWSKKFIGISDDGQNRYTVEFRNNGELFDQKLEKSKSHGVTVEFYPDLERFKVQKLDDVYIDIIRQRLINLNICFPKMSIKLNKKTINVKSFKKYIQMFNKPFEMVEDENYSYAVLPSDSDTFEQISYFNGLKISDGGSHIDVPCTQIVNRLRDKLVKRYKSIKPADIKNKLFIVAFIRNFPNAKFNSQTKEKVTNSIAEINSFINIDYDEFYKKIIKNDLIIDPITEIYKIKEEYKRRQELKSLDKVKKVKDDKYTPSIGKNEYLMICEGYCLDEDTEVLMADYSSKKIKDVKIGESLISSDLTPCKIYAKNKTLQKVITIETETCKVTCSEKHRLYAYDKWTDNFDYYPASRIKEFPYRFQLVKCKLNNDTRYVEVKDNDLTHRILKTSEHDITYTDDTFVIIRNGIVMQGYGIDLQSNDLILLSA